MMTGPHYGSLLNISLMTVIWKSQVSWAVGMISSGGNRNPYRPGIEQSVLKADNCYTKDVKNYSEQYD